MRFFLRISAFAFLFSLLIAAIGCGGGSMGTQNNPASQQKAPTITFVAQPGTVASGASTVLSWTSSNATSVSVSGLGTFPAMGSAKVTPRTTTTYTATAAGPGGTTKSSTVVSVTTSGQTPTITFSAQPSSVAPGASAVLSWSTSNATSVSIAGVGTFGASGSTNVTPPSNGFGKYHSSCHLESAYDFIQRSTQYHPQGRYGSIELDHDQRYLRKHSRSRQFPGERIDERYPEHYHPVHRNSHGSGWYGPRVHYRNRKRDGFVQTAG
jgi:hypothetical protein